MTNYLDLGLEDQAWQFCQGILLGLYSVHKGQDNDVLGWAEDFPADAACKALEVWMSAGAGDGAPAKQKPRRLPPGFTSEHLPD